MLIKRCRCRRDFFSCYLRSLLSETMNTPVGYEELAGGLEPIRNGEIFCMNNNVYCMLIDR